MASEFMIRFYGIEALEAEMIRKGNADFVGVQRKQLRYLHSWPRSVLSKWSCSKLGVEHL